MMKAGEEAGWTRGLPFALSRLRSPTA